MTYEHDSIPVTDEDRREFLKVLGVTGTVAAGGVSLAELREELSASGGGELAPVGEAIKADLTGALDAELLASRQAELAGAASSIPAVVEKGLPADEARDDFGAVAEAGWPVYEHLAEVGFFESTTSHLPEFTPEYLVASVEQFIESERLADALAAVGFEAAEMVDLFAAIVNDRHELSNQLWQATDEIPREQIRGGEYIPPMTQQAAGGALLWLQDLDSHLAQHRVLLSEEILADATWDAHALAAGFHVMTEGASVVAEESSALSESELAALFTTGFSLQTVSQFLLVNDAYWITEEMRGSRRTDIETVPMQ